MSGKKTRHLIAGRERDGINSDATIVINKETMEFLWIQNVNEAVAQLSDSGRGGVKLTDYAHYKRLVSYMDIKVILG